MTAPELLEVLRVHGVQAIPDGAILRFRPGRLVPPELVPELRAHKPEILRLLTAGQAPDPITAYRATLGRLWALNLAGATTDPEEIKRLLEMQAKQCDELGPEFASAVSRQASRDWARRERRCPFCGLEGVYHDPVSGEESALAPRGAWPSR
jgi:hypothetical protein